MPMRSEQGVVRTGRPFEMATPPAASESGIRAPSRQPVDCKLPAKHPCVADGSDGSAAMFQ